MATKNDKDVIEEESPMETQLMKEEQLNVEINLLGDRYSRCEARCSELQEINKKLEYDLLTQKEDQVDIFTYLNTELSKRVEQVASLENQIQAMALAQEKWEKETQQEFSQIRADHDAIISELNRKISEYKSELEDLQDFTKHKNALENKLREVESELGQEHDKHMISLTDLERKHAQDREKIKRDYHERLEADKSELLQKINKQLEFTTRRTMQENEMMTSELAYQNKQTEKIVRGNDRFHSDQMAMKREMELLKQAEEELVKKNQKFQKTIKLLQIKLAATQADSTKADTMQDNHQKSAAEELIKQEETSSALNDKLQAMRHKHTLANRERDAVKAQLDDSRAEVKRMRELKDEAQQFLMECLADARKEFSVQLGEKSAKDWSPDEALPWSLKGLSKVGREALLEHLLIRMGGSHLLADKSRSGRSSRMRAGSPAPDGGVSPSLMRTQELALAQSVGDTPVLPPIHHGLMENTPPPSHSSVLGSWGVKNYPSRQSPSPKLR
eukprot:TRINITY_DN642_c0_g1_i3.p1 TRINITY_DN642_c0_g1~~TRINITY_DN642_c0_g1_i3.p1  ORF type:complete len:503 (-),score=168.91 TRINITY_DN642_c0_g1_i3:88-1596(-)